jgi:hypothetical protein
MRVKLSKVRLSFPALFVPTQAQGSTEKKYGAAFLIDKNDKKNITLVENAMLEAATAKWGAAGAKQLSLLKSTDKVCLRDGDIKADKYEGYEGCMALNANSKVRVKVKDKDPNIDLTAEDGRPYSGCYVNGFVDIYAQDNSFGKRVNAVLMGVQFVADGDAFSGSAPLKDDDFDDLSAEDDNDMMG